MFKLIKIENGRQNVPEPEYLDVAASEAVAICERALERIDVTYE